jgi:hypothetical protein
MVAEPLRMLEIVMPVAGGGAAFIVTRDDIAAPLPAPRRCRVMGCGEHVQSKSPTYASDMLATPIGPASRNVPLPWPTVQAGGHAHGADLRLLHHHGAC